MHARLLVVLAGLSLPLAAPAATETHHHTHDHAASAPAPKAGGKWASDAPLRHGMETIRELVATAVADLRNKRLDASRRQAIAGKIDAEVATIVAECRLAADADAALHAVIAEIADGSGALAGKAPAARALDKLRDALALYGKRFEHPGWQPLHQR